MLPSCALVWRTNLVWRRYGRSEGKPSEKGTSSQRQLHMKELTVVSSAGIKIDSQVGRARTWFDRAERAKIDRTGLLSTALCNEGNQYCAQPVSHTVSDY